MNTAHDPFLYECLPESNDAGARWVARFFAFTGNAQEATSRDQTPLNNPFTSDGCLTSRIRARVNGKRVIQTMDLWPRNVLCTIARHLHILECVEFSKACSRIRNALIGDTTLWNRVWIMDHFNSLNIWSWTLSRTMMQRTAGYPSHLRLTTSIQWFRSGSFQFQLLEDWLLAGGGVTLDMQLHMPFITWGISEPQSFAAPIALILGLFERIGGVPALQYLRLGIPQRTPYLSAENKLPDNFLGGIPGALTELWLDNVSLKAGVQYPALANITAFCSTATTARTVNLSLIVSLLEAMPLLEHLALSNLSIIDLAGAEDVRQLLSKHPLRRIIVMSATGLVAEFIGVLANVQHVAILANYGSEVEPLCDIWPDGDLNMTVASGNVCLQSTQCSIGSQNEGTSISGNSFHEISFVRYPTRTGTAYLNSDMISVPIGHSSRIVSLWMHEWQWASFVWAACNFPRLKELHIVLASCRETRSQTVDCGIFIDQPSGPAHISFLALEQLQLYAFPRPTKDGSQSRCPPFDFRSFEFIPYPPCGCDVGCTLALSDVRDFLERLLPRGRRLKRLILAGMAAIVDINTAGRRSAIDDFSKSIEIWEKAPPEALDRCVSETLSMEIGNTLFGPRVQRLFDGRDTSSLWWPGPQIYE